MQDKITSKLQPLEISYFTNPKFFERHKRFDSGNIKSLRYVDLIGETYNGRVL